MLSYQQTFMIKKIPITELNKYEQAIVKNADWFIVNQRKEGYIDLEGDEFYGVKGDASLIGHSVTVRMYAYALTGNKKYLESAQNSLKWLAERQDAEGGWKKYAGFTLDAAQCVFEGFNTYQHISGDIEYQKVLKKAAERMVRGTIDEQGKLLLLNIIEIGEYAHFCLLAWKTTGDKVFRQAAEIILEHIYNNFDEKEGFWNPYDKSQKTPPISFLIKPLLRWSVKTFPLKGKFIAKFSGSLLPYVVASTHPQYSMSLMDAEALLDTLDNSCSYPKLKTQTQNAIEWVKKHCQGPFPGSLVESRITEESKQVYPLEIINDTTMAAAWPTSCLLLVYCGLNGEQYKKEAKQTADYLISMQDEKGGFYNFQKPDKSFLPLQSGNVNFYVSMALWIYNEVYENGKIKLFTVKI